ncbi:16364_t:CDS:1, partial [Acaulospora colombiana]
TEAQQNTLPKRSWDEQVASKRDSQENLNINKDNTNPQEQGRHLEKENRTIRIDDTDMETNSKSEIEQDQPWFTMLKGK